MFIEYETSIISAILCCISALGAIVAFVLYLVLPALRDFQGRWLLIILVCLFVNTLVQFHDKIKTLLGYGLEQECIPAGIITYAENNAFCWLIVLSFETWRWITCPELFANNKRGVTIWCVVYATCLSALLTLLPYIGHHAPGGHIKPFVIDTCSFQSPLTLFLYYFLPLVILSVKSFVFLCLTSWSMWRKWKTGPSNRLKFFILLTTYLIVNLSILWITIIILWIQHDIYRFIVNCVYSLQGFFLFLTLVLCRKRARWYLIRKLACCRWLPRSYVNGISEEELTIAEDAEEHSSSDKTVNTAYTYDCGTENIKMIDDP